MMDSRTDFVVMLVVGYVGFVVCFFVYKLATE